MSSSQRNMPLSQLLHASSGRRRRLVVKLRLNIFACCCFAGDAERSLRYKHLPGTSAEG
jgi:hypothetical protein